MVQTTSSKRPKASDYFYLESFPDSDDDLVPIPKPNPGMVHQHHELTTYHKLTITPPAPYTPAGFVTHLPNTTIASPASFEEVHHRTKPLQRTKPNLGTYPTPCVIRHLNTLTDTQPLHHLQRRYR